MARPALGVLLCTCLGCFDPALSAGIACSAEGECPAGLECDPVDGVCRDTPLGGASGEDESEPSSGDEPDATPPGPEQPIDVDMPFSQPVRIDELSSNATDTDPSLTADMLEIYFSSSRAGGAGAMDLWVAKRRSVLERWGTPTPVVELNSPSDDVDPEVSGDGLTMWITSERAGGQGGQDIYLTTRASRSEAWATPTPVSELNTSFDDASAAPDSSLLFATLCTTRSGNKDVFVTSRTSITGEWSSPTPATAVNTTDAECAPFFYAGATALYLSSSRDGGAGSRDLWVASRVDDSSPFETPRPVTELNTSATESDPWLSIDGQTIVFTSTRGDSEDIYTATR